MFLTMVGILLTTVGTVGYVSEVRKEKKREKIINQIPKNTRDVLEALNKCRVGNAGPKDNETISMSPLGNIFAGFVIRESQMNNPKTWVEGLEKEIQENLKRK